jgi:hypothetical protein
LAQKKSLPATLSLEGFFAQDSYFIKHTQNHLPPHFYHFLEWRQSLSTSKKDALLQCRTKTQLAPPPKKRHIRQFLYDANVLNMQFKAPSSGTLF